MTAQQIEEIAVDPSKFEPAGLALGRERCIGLPIGGKVLKGLSPFLPVFKIRHAGVVFTGNHSARRYPIELQCDRVPEKEERAVRPYGQH
jgi:hypothetical protein